MSQGGRSITWEVMETAREWRDSFGMTMESPELGALLRDWRQRRRLSQLDLALEAEISPRHMSFVETGRSRPSRDVVVRLADSLDLTPRNRNALLIAAGFAPASAERRYDDPGLTAARDIVQRILNAHMPYPALAVDRHWNMVANNDAVMALLGGVSPDLMRPPVNVLRLSLHPDGLGKQIANLAEWKRHLLERLDRQVEASGDAVLADLRAELAALPAPASAGPAGSIDAIAVPLELDSAIGRLSFLSMTTMFGTPVEVTLSEIAIESFFPADPETAERLGALA